MENSDGHCSFPLFSKNLPTSISLRFLSCSSRAALHHQQHQRHTFQLNSTEPNLHSRGSRSLHNFETMAFITPFASSFTASPRNAQITTRRPVRAARFRMGLGEDGLKEDMAFAQNCIEEGCSVDAVQDVLTRLERRRGVLALEVSQIEEIMAILAKENLGGDRNLIADAMAAAVSIFAKANDDYPGVGASTNPWTLDPLKKQPKL